MKLLYIESKQKNLTIKTSKAELKKLPKKLFLAYSIQYKDLAILYRKEQGYGKSMGGLNDR